MHYLCMYICTHINMHTRPHIASLGGFGDECVGVVGLGSGRAVSVWLCGFLRMHLKTCVVLYVCACAWLPICLHSKVATTYVHT